MSGAGTPRFRVTHGESGTTLAERAVRADTFFRRLRGLMFRAELPAGDGLWIEPCAAIHSCFMRFPIDALFLDPEHRVVEYLAEFAPFRFSRYHARARSVLELPSRAASGIPNLVGTALIFEPIPQEGPDSSHGKR